MSISAVQNWASSWVKISFFMSRFIRSPPGKYSITRYRLSLSWKEHLSPTTHGFFYEMASTFLSSRDCMTLFLKIISHFLSFLTATGSLDLFHLQSLTSPKAPLPMILMGLKSKMVIFLRSSLSCWAYSCEICFLNSFCSFCDMPSACIFWLSCSQYSFFCCYCWIILEQRCSMKFLAASTFYFVDLDTTISLGFSAIALRIKYYRQFEFKSRIIEKETFQP